MRLMGPSEDRWFDLAQLAWTEHTWMVQLNESHGSISHRPCPWGGHLLKFSFDHVHVSNCAQAAGVMIRPELRPLAREGVNVHQHVAPGDVVLTGPSVAIEVGDESCLHKSVQKGRISHAFASAAEHVVFILASRVYPMSQGVVISPVSPGKSLTGSTKSHQACPA